MHRAADDQLGGYLAEHGEAGAPLEHLRGRLHQDGDTAGPEEEDVFRPARKAAPDHLIDGLGKRHRTGLDPRNRSSSKLSIAISRALF